MNRTECHLLDDYLDGDLSPTEEVRFETHLTDCENCLAAVNQQRWMEQLLRESNNLVSLPTELGEVSLSPPKKSIPWRATIATAVAASLLMAVAFWDDGPRNLQEPIAEKSETPPGAKQSAPRLVQVEMPKATPVATFVAEDDVIVVPVESDSQEVTIIQVYPTAQARSRWRREALLQTSSVTYPGG